MNKDKDNNEITLVDVFVKLREAFKFIWSKKISILFAGIIGGGIGLSYAILKPIEYESKLTFIVDQAGDNKGLGALGGIASSFGFGSMSGEGGLFENQANLINFIKSRSLVEKALITAIPGTNQTFAERFINVYGWRKDSLLKNIHYFPNQSRESFSLTKDSVLFEVYNYFLDEELINVIIPDEDGSIIAIHFKSLDDTLANYFPNVLLNQVSKSYIDAKTKLAKDNVSILQHQTDSVRNELNRALYNSASQTDEVFNLNPAFTMRRVPANKEQIDVRASSILLEELIKNLELAKVQLKNLTPIIEVIDQPRFPLKTNNVSKIQMIFVFSLCVTLFWIFLFAVVHGVKKMKTHIQNIENKTYN